MIEMYGKAHDGRDVEVSHEDLGRLDQMWVAHIRMNIGGVTSELRSGHSGAVNDGGKARSEFDRLALEDAGIDTRTLRIRPSDELLFPNEAVN